MGERNQESIGTDALEDLFEPALGELMDEDLDDPTPISSGKALLAEKRRRAERRLEQKRLQEELGYCEARLEAQVSYGLCHYTEQRGSKVYKRTSTDPGGTPY